MMSDTTVKARYEKTIFYNEDSGFCIFVMKTTDTSVPSEARKKGAYYDKRIRFTAKGYGFPTTDAVELELSGEWESTQYGLQMNVEFWEEIVPLTLDGIRGYLGCGLIKGIGEATAAEIVRRFGLDSLNVIEQHPEKLLELRGITKNRLEDIIESFNQSRTLRNLISFLAPHGITPGTAQRIQNFFGSSAVSILRERPFELCRISGFGFIRVDEIARKIGCRPNDPQRIKGAINYALTESQGHDGHLYLPVEDLCMTVYKLLNDKIPVTARIEPTEVSDALCDMAEAQTVITDGGGVYLPGAYSNEDTTAMKIAELIGQPCVQYSIDAALMEAKLLLSIEPSPQQENTVKMVLHNNISTITGSPGTGKTTVLKLVIDVFRRVKPGCKIILAAPTGRASRRMAESTGDDTASTLHSALGIVSEELSASRDDTELLDADLIIVDEFSMVDMWLASEFTKRIRPGTKVLLVGDVDQLPSVGAGNVFRELINCGIIPVTVLNRIFRQAKDSLVAHNSKLINEDDTRLYYGQDFSIDELSTQTQAAAKLIEIYLDVVSRVGVENVQILSPFRADGEASAEKLSLAIREVVNPFTSAENELHVGERIFRIGDRVMQTKNQKDISNGDLGFIREIKRGDATTVTIEFAGGRFAKYGTAQLNVIELAYAMTIHKAMGSEFGVVLMPVLMAHTVLLNRCLLYTAVTRAKSSVHLVGQRKALIIAIHKQVVDKRNTQLGRRIRKYRAALSGGMEKKAG